MAQLELTRVMLTSGTSPGTASMRTPVETEGGTGAPSPSFSQLLQGNGTSGSTAGTVAASPAPGSGVDGGSTVAANPQAARVNSAVIDPASLDQAEAGQQLAALAATLDLELATGEGEPVEPKEIAVEANADDSNDLGDSDSTDGEMLSAVPWLGLSLVMEARAALRNRESATDAAATPSGATATDTVNSTRSHALSCSTAALSPVASGGRDSARLVGDPASNIPVGGNPSLAALATAGEAGEWPLPGANSSVLAASGDVAITDAATTKVGMTAAVETEETAALGRMNGGTAVMPPQELRGRRVEARSTVGWTGATMSGSEAPGAASLTATAANTAPLAAATLGDESITTSQASVASGQQSIQQAGGKASREYPRLAEAFARSNSDPAVEEESASGDKARPEVVTATGSASRSLASVSHDASELLTTARADQRLADAGMATTSPHSGKTVLDTGIVRASESTIPATGGTTALNILDLQQKNWGRVLGHQLSWMVNNQAQEAEIKVNPPDLGPLEVRMSLHHNQTNVTFFSHEAAVREAIESALPRLREMLDNQGITLNQAHVSDQSLARQQAGSGEQPAYGQRGGELPTTDPGVETTAAVTESRPRSRRLPGMVDDYV